MTSTPSFIDALGVTPSGHAAEFNTETFAAKLPEAWQSLLGVHGGFTTALAAAAVSAVEPDRHIRTVHAAFLRPTKVGPVDITVTSLRQGRTLSTYRASVCQSGMSALDVRVTLCEPTAGPSWTSDLLPRSAPLDSCLPFQPPPSVRSFGHHELRLDPDHIPTSDADNTRLMGHLRPVDMTTKGALWLIMAGDAFPPAPFRRLEPPQGGVSIDYTVHLHAQRATGEWVEGSFLAADSHDGLAIEHGALRDADGTLLAETFHSRWTV